MMAIYEDPDETRLILLGKTGCGKSSSGNTILGWNAFDSICSGSSLTQRCSHQSATRFGKRIVIVDTPGIFDTEETHTKIQQEISKCIGFTSPGPHAFIFVHNILSRFTQEDHSTINQFSRLFGENVFKYFFVLFTRKDVLERNQSNIQDFIKNSPQQLTSFIQKCGGRVLAFDNTLQGAEQSIQVEELLSEVQENLKKNGGKYYTNEMYEEAERQILTMEEKEEKRGKELEKKIDKITTEELLTKKNKKVEKSDQEFIAKKDEQFCDEVRKQIWCH